MTVLRAFSFMRALPTAEKYHWQSSITFSGMHISLMKLEALRSMFCKGHMEVFHWFANLPERHYLMPPMLGGYLVQ